MHASVFVCVDSSEIEPSLPLMFAACEPQAMISGEQLMIADYALSASSVWDDRDDHGPAASRLHLAQGPWAGAWCAGTNDAIMNTWIQVRWGS